MKKNLVKSILLIFIFCIVMFSQNHVEAKLGEKLNTSIYNQVTSETDTELDSTLYKIAGTVIYILQILAMAGVVITGVKYMYAESQDKAKIKQTLIWIVIGTIFVFAAPRVINFVSKSGNIVFK